MQFIIEVLLQAYREVEEQVRLSEGKDIAAVRKKEALSQMIAFLRLLSEAGLQITDAQKRLGLGDRDDEPG